MCHGLRGCLAGRLYSDCAAAIPSKEKSLPVVSVFNVFLNRVIFHQCRHKHLFHHLLRFCHKEGICFSNGLGKHFLNVLCDDGQTCVFLQIADKLAGIGYPETQAVSIATYTL